MVQKGITSSVETTPQTGARRGSPAGESSKLRKNPTFDEFFTYAYLPHIKARKRSWSIDERLGRRHISGVLGHLLLGAITPPQIEAWLTSLCEKGLAKSSCNRILAILKSVFALAEFCGYIPAGSSPARQTRGFKITQTRERYLSTEEARRLMAHLGKEPRLEAKAIQLLLLTGARKSEILNARWQDLDLERGILTVPVSKSGKIRHVYLSQEAIRIFRSIGRVAKSIWIFPGRNPEKHIADVYRYWHQTRCALGLKDVRLHDLRHSFASFLVGSGHTLYVAQQLLGHSDPRMTMRYAHFASSMLLTATQSVALAVCLGERDKTQKIAGL